MLEVFAGVLAARHGGVQPCFRDGQPDFGGITFCRSFPFSNLHGKVYCSCFVRVTLLQRHRDFCPAGGLQNCLPRFLCTTANEFHRPVYHHFWCVRATASESLGIKVLTQRPVPRRERVGPTQIVPVIDVLLQGDQLYIPGQSFFGQLRQQSIRRWTA